MANKINYGIKNVYYALRNSGDTAWETPVAIPGAVKLSLTTTGSKNIAYADDSEYVSYDIGGGYEGDFETMLIPDSVFTSLIGFITDTYGAIVETSSKVAVPFALLFEVEGDEKNRRYAFYNVTATRPAFNANTTNDSTTPDTQTLSITCSGRDITSGSGSSAITKNVVKCSMERSTTSATAYDAWFTSVYEPTFSAA